MVKIVYTQNAVNDLVRLTDFLIEIDIKAASETINLIEDAISILDRHPLIGRAVDEEIRELVISRGATGYVALYSVEEHKNAILILAIRHQREAGFNFN
ncbi:MAG: type II toxin-antitoxin system RelE/ParE family toxin [Methylophilaceae bacterium]